MAGLVARLRSAGRARWQAIAVDAGVTPTMVRKIAYGERTNPGVLTVERLLAYFAAVDRGERRLPDPAVDRIAQEG